MRYTTKRNGKNVIPLLNAACGIDMPYWRIDRADDLHSYLSGDAADKLAAYEDMGLSPEEIKLNMDGLDEYHKAEAEGRLVILPCKVGDTVWWIPPASFTWLELRPYCCMIVSMTITENKKRERKKKYRLAELRDGKTIDNVRDVDFEDFGKTVFLTREAAEAAMMKWEKKDV